MAGLAAGASTKRRPNLAPGPKNTAIPVDALVRVRVLQKLTTEVYMKKIVKKFLDEVRGCDRDRGLQTQQKLVNFDPFDIVNSVGSESSALKSD